MFMVFIGHTLSTCLPACLDLTSHAIVLRAAAELGLAPKVCRALGAMYRQLRRVFKLAGCLGQWWHATNGILQGCPLSVILVNVLTGIWKEEVNFLRQQVCVRTRALPPTFFTVPIPSTSIPGENGNFFARRAAQRCARARGQNQFWPARPRDIAAKYGYVTGGTPG